MAERVDLHIGLPNAGTAYLQQLLFDNLGTLGVGLVGESPRALDRAAREIAELGGGAQWQVVADAVSAAPDRILLSCEGFSAADAAGAARAVRDLAPADVRVICTVQHPARLIPLAWKQHVRSGATESLDEFVDGLRDGTYSRLVPDAVNVVDAWAAAVPAADLHVVVVPSSAESGSGLWPLFASATDLDPTIAERWEWKDGSPGDVTHELLRRVNVALGDRVPDAYRRYRELVRPLLRSADGDVGRRMTLSQDDTAWATERGRSFAAALGQRSHPVHGDLADLHAATTDDSVEAGPVDDAAIAPPAVEMIAALLTTLRNTRARIPDQDKQTTLRNTRARIPDQDKQTKRRNARARIPDQDKQTKRRARAATRGLPGPDGG